MCALCVSRMKCIMCAVFSRLVLVFVLCVFSGINCVMCAVFLLSGSVSNMVACAYLGIMFACVSL